VINAIQLSPRDPSRGAFYWILGRAHFFMQSYHDAIAWLQNSIDEKFDIIYNRLYLVSAYALIGSQENAHITLSEFNDIFPKYTIERLVQDETHLPNSNPVFVSGQQALHEGLQIAGMPVS
jgi:tetratricopeptide (TPR) repeat protein